MRNLFITAFAVLLLSGLAAGLDSRCSQAAPRGDAIISQPAGSLDITNQTQLTPLGLRALSGNPSTDPANLQAILYYVSGTALPDPVRHPKRPQCR